MQKSAIEGLKFHAYVSLIIHGSVLGIPLIFETYYIFFIIYILL